MSWPVLPSSKSSAKPTYVVALERPSMVSLSAGSRVRSPTMLPNWLRIALLSLALSACAMFAIVLVAIWITRLFH